MSPAFSLCWLEALPCGCCVLPASIGFFPLFVGQMSSVLELPGHCYASDEIPGLLAELELMPLLVRRYLERRFAAQHQPSQEQQVAFQQGFLARERISDQAALAAWLQRQGVSEAQMSQRLYRALQLEQFKQITFGPRLEPLFLERKASLDQVMYSLLRVRERAKALELHLRLQEEEATFADLASTYSEGVEQKLNGLIGPMELGRINPALAERLRISTPGQLWPPFETQGWWVVLRHERHLPAQLDAAMQQRLLNEMYELWMREQVSAAMAQMQPAAGSVHESAPAPAALLSELPCADALQPEPATAPSAEAQSDLSPTLLGLG